MSNKSKKRARAKARRKLVPAAQLQARAAAVASSPVRQQSLAQSRVGGSQALVRSVEMSLGATNKLVKGSRGQTWIEAADASIPLDRVPYFTRDLVRLAIIAAAMVVLLGAGSYFVPIVVNRLPG